MSIKTHIQQAQATYKAAKIGRLPTDVPTEADWNVVTDGIKHGLTGLPAAVGVIGCVATAITLNPVVGALTIGAISATSLLDVTRPMRDGHWLLPPKPEKKPEPVKLEPKVDWYSALQETLDAYEIKADVVQLNDSGKVLDLYKLDVKKGYDIQEVTRKGANFSRDLGLGVGELVSVEANIGNKQAGLYLPKANRGKVEFDPKNPPKEFIEFAKTAALPMYFGETVDGTPIMYDLAKQPHIFYGGETQSGKSVAINTGLVSLMSVRTPEQVKVAIIDPKKVDLQHLNNEPHMIRPAVTDMSVAYKMLGKIVEVMQKRYDAMGKRGVVNIEQYNELKGVKPMPYIVTTVEEMTVAVDNEVPLQSIEKGARKSKTIGSGIQDRLVELAIAARACGIHLVIGVQRFDADTFKGQLRDNVPAAIGMSVRKRQASEMIIGQGGCERLLKYGDAYMMLSGGEPVRCHGAMVV